MITQGLKGRDFITLRDFSKAEVDTVLDVSLRFKAENTMRRRHTNILEGRIILMMFFNPSYRTRNSFEAGIFQLGGHAHFLEPSVTRVPALNGEEIAKQTERILDVARVLSRMGDAIAICVLDDVVGWEYDKGLRIIQESAAWAEEAPAKVHGEPSQLSRRGSCVVFVTLCAPEMMPGLVQSFSVSGDQCSLILHRSAINDLTQAGGSWSQWSVIE